MEEYFLDNLSIDNDGQLLAAGESRVTQLGRKKLTRRSTAVPRLLLAGKHMKDPSLTSPTLILRLSINTGPNAFYGEKYKVEKVQCPFLAQSCRLLIVRRLSKMMVRSCRGELQHHTIQNEESYIYLVFLFLPTHSHVAKRCSRHCVSSRCCVRCIIRRGREKS